VRFPILEAWLTFKQETMPLNMSAGTEAQLKRVFYCGAIAVVAEGQQASGYDEEVALGKDLKNEIAAFYKELSDDLSSNFRRNLYPDA
jgi:hypothetical protein